jgi:hypothetical protein
LRIGERRTDKRSQHVDEWERGGYRVGHTSGWAAVSATRHDRQVDPGRENKSGFSLFPFSIHRNRFQAWKIARDLRKLEKILGGRLEHLEQLLLFTL